MKFPASIHSVDQLTSMVWEIEEALSSTRIGSGTSLRLSRTTEQFLALNGIRQLDSQTYEALQKNLNAVRSNAKQIHVTTGAVSSASWREQIVVWLRKEIDEHAFCSFTTDTQQGGGIILRTPKQQYDMTIKSKISVNKQRLVEMV